jgi:hypothetical protein
MAVIGDYGNRLAIVARQHALNRAAPVRLEGDPLANPELEHVRVGADVLQQTKALDNPMVEVDQFGFRQPINVDHHEASPSALNGVSTLQRPAGKRKPRNARAASVMAVLSEGCWQEYGSYPQDSRMNLAGDDPEHAVVVPGSLLAPTTKTGLMAEIAGDEVAGGGATAHPTVILA